MSRASAWSSNPSFSCRISQVSLPSTGKGTQVVVLKMILQPWRTQAWLQPHITGPYAITVWCLSDSHAHNRQLYYRAQYPTIINTVAIKTDADSPIVWVQIRQILIIRWDTGRPHVDICPLTCCQPANQWEEIPLQLTFLGRALVWGLLWAYFQSRVTI